MTRAKFSVTFYVSPQLLKDTPAYEAMTASAFADAVAANGGREPELETRELLDTPEKCEAFDMTWDSLMTPVLLRGTAIQR